MITLADVYAARPHVYAALRPTPLLRHPLLADALGARRLREAREPPADGRVQGARRPQPGREAHAGRARARRHHRDDRQPRAVDRVCLPARSACRARSSSRSATTPRRTRRCARGAPSCSSTAATSTRRARRWSGSRVARGLRYVHSANEPWLIAGVGTYALEIFEELPDADVVLVPIGGGSGACGLVTVRNGLGSRARIIGVQAAGADAFARSWRSRHARDRRACRHVRRGPGDARHLRPAVVDPLVARSRDPRTRRHRDGRRRGSSRPRCGSRWRRRTTWWRGRERRRLRRPRRSGRRSRVSRSSS